MMTHAGQSCGFGFFSPVPPGICDRFETALMWLAHLALHVAFANREIADKQPFFFHPFQNFMVPVTCA